jgi:hypothetical protein
VELLQVDVADGCLVAGADTTVVRYDGVPRTQTIPGFDIESGFIHTDDGALIAGEPRWPPTGTPSTIIRWTKRPTPSR